MQGTFVRAESEISVAWKDLFALYFERIAFQAAEVSRSIANDPKLPAIDDQVVQIDPR